MVQDIKSYLNLQCNDTDIDTYLDLHFSEITAANKSDVCTCAIAGGVEIDQAVSCPALFSV